MIAERTAINIGSRISRESPEVHVVNEEPTVFIVDDDLAIRKSLAWLIESVGLQVQSFASAPEFLEFCDDTLHGCLLLDIRMPRMGGLELLEKLAANNLRIPVVVITGYGSVPAAVRAMKLGAIDFLEKPVSDDVLLEHIHRAIALDAAERQKRTERSAVARRFEALTNREREVLQLLVRGLTAKEIAQALHIGLKTVESHRSKILRKMEARSLPHLVRLGLLVPSLNDNLRGDH
jgi:FixJ family two-component response regulator